MNFKQSFVIPLGLYLLLFTFYYKIFKINIDKVYEDEVQQADMSSLEFIENPLNNRRTAQNLINITCQNIANHKLDYGITIGKLISGWNIFPYKKHIIDMPVVRKELEFKI